MRRSLLALSLALLPCLSSAREDPDRHAYAKHLLGDVTRGWNWTAAGTVAGTAVGSYLLYRWADPSLDGTASPAFESGSKVLSDFGLIASLAAPLGFLTAGFLEPKGGKEREELLMTAEQLTESLLFAGGTALLLKYSVGRERPNGSDHGFPSMHTSLSFSTAGILLYRTPWYVGIPSLLAASAVGLSRIDLREHYPSDVLAGAGIGFLFATLVHAYHRKFESTPPLLPLVTGDTLGLAWSASF